MASSLRSTISATKSLTALLRPGAHIAQKPRLFLPLQSQARLLSLRATPVLRRNHEDDHRAHTIMQRLKELKKIPVELLPLGVVLVVAVIAAVYSLGYKLMNDKTLKLHRTNRAKNP